MKPMKIGVCGTGRMGSALAQRLLSVGREVTVWNRDAAKTRPLVQAGAKHAISPAELVAGCDTVIVMLLNDEALESVYRAPGGLLLAGLDGKQIIDMSPVLPEAMGAKGNAWVTPRSRFAE